MECAFEAVAVAVVAVPLLALAGFTCVRAGGLAAAADDEVADVAVADVAVAVVAAPVLAGAGVPCVRAGGLAAADVAVAVAVAVVAAPVLA